MFFILSTKFQIPYKTGLRTPIPLPTGLRTPIPFPTGLRTPIPVPVPTWIKPYIRKEENCVDAPRKIKEAGYMENFPWNILIECIPTVVDVIGSYLKKSEENCVVEAQQAASSLSAAQGSEQAQCQQILAMAHSENFPWNILIECIPTVVDVIGSYLKKSEENCVPSSVSTHMQQIQEAGAYIENCKKSKHARDIEAAGAMLDSIENFPWNILIECIPTVVDVIGSYLKKEENCPAETSPAGPGSSPSGMTVASIMLSGMENFPWDILIECIPTVVEVVGSWLKKSEENFPWNILIECIPTVVDVIGSYLKKSEENCGAQIAAHQQAVTYGAPLIDSI